MFLLLVRALEGHFNYWLNEGSFYRAIVMLQRKISLNEAHLHLSYNHLNNVNLFLFAKICHKVLSTFSDSLATYICHSAVHSVLNLVTWVKP